MKQHGNNKAYTYMVSHRILLPSECSYRHVDMGQQGVLQLPLISGNPCYIYSEVGKKQCRTSSATLTTDHLTTALHFGGIFFLFFFFYKFSPSNFCITASFHKFLLFLSFTLCSDLKAMNRVVQRPLQIPIYSAIKKQRKTTTYS